MYKAKVNGDIGVKGAKVIGNQIPLGYKKTADFFVDNSGLGSESELAYTFDGFLKEVKAGYYYGISEVGQFQVYISEFKKVSRAIAYKEQGIESSKLISKSCRVTKYNNGDLTVKLYATDILQIKSGKIILSSGGYKTVTTKARINQFFSGKVYQKNGNWFIDYGDKKAIEFFDGIEL
jgi:hypothetical protein